MIRCGWVTRYIVRHSHHHRRWRRVGKGIGHAGKVIGPVVGAAIPIATWVCVDTGWGHGHYGGGGNAGGIGSGFSSGLVLGGGGFGPVGSGGVPFAVAGQQTPETLGAPSSEVGNIGAFENVAVPLIGGVGTTGEVGASPQAASLNSAPVSSPTQPEFPHS